MGFISHKQPALEANLRKVMSSTPFSDLRPSSTVVGISENDDWVYCRYLDGIGTERRVRSRFFVGADGKTGYTRKHYLEAKRIKLERSHQYASASEQTGHVLLTYQVLLRRDVGCVELAGNAAYSRDSSRLLSVEFGLLTGGCLQFLFP